jgi:hypothetical protein
VIFRKRKKVGRFKFTTNEASTCMGARESDTESGCSVSELVNAVNFTSIVC